MTCQGTVKSFNGMKGWGFINYEGKDVFLHVKDCKDGTPATGDILTFDLEEDPISNGRMKASNITGCTGTAEDKGKGKGKGKVGTGSCHGSVKSFNTQKGWGFITFEGTDIFVHAKDCHGGGIPQAGDWVQFDVEDDPVRGEGNKKASNVTGGTGWDNFNGGGFKGDDGWGKGKGKAKGGYGPMWDGGWGKGCWGKDSWGAGPYGKGADMWGGGGGCWGKGYGKCKGGW